MGSDPTQFSPIAEQLRRAMPRATAAWQVNRMSYPVPSVSSSTQFQTRPDQTLGSDQFCPRPCEVRMGVLVARGETCQ
ncbi:unnamed protein product [Boreogadus saida]